MIIDALFDLFFVLCCCAAEEATMKKIDLDKFDCVHHSEMSCPYCDALLDRCDIEATERYYNPCTLEANDGCEFFKAEETKENGKNNNNKNSAI